MNVFVIVTIFGQRSRFCIVGNSNLELCDSDNNNINETVHTRVDIWDVYVVNEYIKNNSISLGSAKAKTVRAHTHTHGCMIQHNAKQFDLHLCAIDTNVSI